MSSWISALSLESGSGSPALAAFVCIISASIAGSWEWRDSEELSKNLAARRISTDPFSIESNHIHARDASAGSPPHFWVVDNGKTRVYFSLLVGVQHLHHFVLGCLDVRTLHWFLNFYEFNKSKYFCAMVNKKSQKQDDRVILTNFIEFLIHAQSVGGVGGIIRHVAPLILLGVSTLNSSAASIVLAPPPGWNGFFIQAQVDAGFKENGGTGSLLSSSSTSRLVVDYAEGSPVSVGYEFVSDPISVSASPSILGAGSGGPKDGASGAMIFSYKVGTLAIGSQDRLAFSFTGTTSAVNSYCDFGAGLVPADAYFSASLSVICYGPIPAAYSAAFGLPAMPSLSDPTQESISGAASIEEGAASPLLLASQSGGSPAVSVPLEIAGYADYFKYEMNYTIRTPFGSDPVFAYEFTGSASVVPECGVSVMCCLGVIISSARRRR